MVINAWNKYFDHLPPLPSLRKYSMERKITVLSLSNDLLFWQFVVCNFFVKNSIKQFLANCTQIPDYNSMINIRWPFGSSGLILLKLCERWFEKCCIDSMLHKKLVVEIDNGNIETKFLHPHWVLWQRYIHFRELKLRTYNIFRELKRRTYKILRELKQSTCNIFRELKLRIYKIFREHKPRTYNIYSENTN